MDSPKLAAYRDSITGITPDLRGVHFSGIIPFTNRYFKHEYPKYNTRKLKLTEIDWWFDRFTDGPKYPSPSEKQWLMRKYSLNLNKFQFPNSILKSGPDMVWMGQLDIDGTRKYIEIVGETHTTLMEKDNFYTELGEKELSATDLLVEHTILACDIHPEEIHLFTESIKRSGSEYIFLKKNDVIKCIDNRVEFGLWDAQIIKLISDKIYSISDTPTTEYKSIISDILIVYIEQIVKLHDNKPFFYRQPTLPSSIRSKLTKVYDMHQTIFSEQLQICSTLNQYSLSKLSQQNIVPNVTNWHILVTTLQMIFQNISKMSSLCVDINILKHIYLSDNNHIMVFVGINHATHLTSLLESSLVDISSIVVYNKYPDQSDLNVFPETDRSNKSILDKM
jgi:hypothetical protein